jgi:hypothetical protein
VVVCARKKSPIFLLAAAATGAECFYLLDFIAKSVAFGSHNRVLEKCVEFSKGKMVFLLLLFVFNS